MVRVDNNLNRQSFTVEALRPRKSTLLLSKITVAEVSQAFFDFPVSFSQSLGCGWGFFPQHLSKPQGIFTFLEFHEE